MIPVHCRVKHDPPNSYGDCLRACIASLLEMEPDDVPHFADNGVDWPTMLADLRAWLLDAIGEYAWVVQYSSEASDAEIRSLIAELNPKQYYLLFSEDHVVVCLDDKIVHDPAWYRTALRTPREAWTVMVLVRNRK